jgi:hypothetical protein
MSTLNCSIAALMLARGHMTNQQRVDTPLTRTEATRFVLESRSVAHVFFGLNRLMDIAFDLWVTDTVAAKELWKEVGRHMQAVEAIDPNLLGFKTLRRYVRANVDRTLTDWAGQEMRRRDPDQQIPSAA